MSPARHFTHFGRYEIVRKLGRSLCDVYLAVDPARGLRVVLKIVEKCRDQLTALVVEAERRGAMIQQQLHAADPRILEIYEFGEQNGCFFVAMQYAEGTNLADLLRQKTRLDPMLAARYAAEICSQLASLHSFEAEIDGRRQAVVHGDVKPANIQIGAAGEVWLLDFGIAKAITATRNLTHHDLGSPAYCSPERLTNSQVNPHSDLWAVGVCLYEMVAGLPPYQAQTTRKLENLIQSRRPPRALPDNCPPALRSVIRKALAPDSSRRYDSAAAFERDLRSFLAGRLTVAERESQPVWNANATIEKDREQPPPKRAVVARARLAPYIARFQSVKWSLLAGLLAGLFIFVPGMQALRFWRDAEPLRAQRDYATASVSLVDTDWRLYSRMKRDYEWLGGFSPAEWLSGSLRRRLTACGDRLIADYRNRATTALDQIDWRRARACLTRAAAMEPANTQLKGKLKLVEGYLSLIESPALPSTAHRSLEEAASLLPNAPDPHLGLARVYLYGLGNLGLAIAELHTAERLGYRLGPREWALQADGYLIRAEHAFGQFQKARPAAEQRRWFTQLRRDLVRARDLYEPITGFGDVGRSLERVHDCRQSAEAIQAERDRERARLEASRRYARYRRWR